MKIPICKYCGKRGHWSYQCFQKNKVLCQRQKMRSKASKTLSKAPFGSKTYKVLSLEQNDQNERRKLIRELDKYTSLICRIGASNKKGYATCYCCGVKIPWRQGDCGHYVKRSYMDTRWLQANVRFCCVNCNRYLNGNYSAYEAHLKREIGIDGVQKLWDKAYKRTKFQTYELREMLLGIKQEYKALLEKKRLEQNNLL